MRVRFSVVTFILLSLTALAQAEPEEALLPAELDSPAETTDSVPEPEPASAVFDENQPPAWPEPQAPPLGAVQIDADRISGENKHHLSAEGDVHLVDSQREVEAERLEYFSDPERVIADGRIRFAQEGLQLWAEHVDYLPASATGNATRVRYQIQQRGRSGQGSADAVRFRGKNQYDLSNGEYTTCDPERKDWYLQAGHLDLDFNRNVGEVRHARLYFKGVPIGWLPWADFPLNGQRKSGLLAPRLGTTTTGGLDLAIPVYFNLAPNYDFTLNNRWMARRGYQAGGLIRYLTEHSSGELNAEGMLHDSLTGEARNGLVWKHQTRFSSHWRSGFDLQQVSDDRYFTDLGDRLSSATQVNLPREGWLRYDSDAWHGLMRVQHYQTLQDPAAPITPPYWRSPQILLNGQQRLGGGFDLGLTSEWVRFSHPTLVNGERLHLYPSFSYPLHLPYVFITPKLGAMYTRYDLKDGRTATRTLPVVSLDSGLTFERELTLGDRRYTQTLEPRLYYVYIPYRDQQGLPLFDTDEMNFNFAQLFSENRFSGVDRINDANQVTMAVTSRWLDSETGHERFRLAIGQRFFFNDQRVQLNTNTASADSASDVVLWGGGEINRRLRMDGYLQYDERLGKIQRMAGTLNYTQRPGAVINLGYHFADQNMRQFDIAGQWPLTRSWYGVGRYLWSQRDREALDTIVGLEYNAGCWGLRLVHQRYKTSLEEYSKATFVQLELSGLGQVGSNPLRMLKDSISGYRRSTELAPTDSE